MQRSQIQLRIKGLRNIKGYIAIRPVQFPVTQDFGRMKSQSASEISQAAGVLAMLAQHLLDLPLLRSWCR